MSIVTITFHPTIDKYFTVPDLLPNSKLHAGHVVRKPGGGGLNISKVLDTLGISSTSIYAMGGLYAPFFIDLIKKENYASEIVTTESDIRENIIILNEKTKEEFRFNMPLNELTDRNYDDFLTAIKRSSIPKYLVLSGSFGNHFSSVWYEQLTMWCETHQVKLIVDTKGENLRKVCALGAFLIKPNLKEFNMITSKSAQSKEEIISEGIGLLQKYPVSHILVSMGKVGVLWITKNKQHFFPSIQVDGFNSVGTGDSFLAGVIKELAAEKSMEEAIDFGILCGAASAMNTNNSILELKDLNQLRSTLK